MRKKIVITNSKNLTIGEAHDLFIRKCTVQNLSEKTLKVYKNHFGLFALTIDVNTPINSVTSAAIDDFILYLKKKKVINANAVPMILVRNTHKIQGIINRTHNNKSFFSFPP